MSEKELAKVLLDLGAAELANRPGWHAETERVFARDRRRITWLAALTGACWLISVVVLYAFIAQCLSVMYLKAPPPAVDPQMQVVYRFLLALAGSIEALVFALLGTVTLLFTTRRAGLRRINASLIEIAQKLERLERQGGPRS